MIYDEDLTLAEKRLISLLKGKNRMEIDEILENDCDLSCGRYKDYNEYKEEPEDPIDIISDVLTKEQELTMALEKLNSMIK